MTTAPSNITLRPYQVADITRIRDAMATSRRVLYQLPTGGGKTVTFGWIARAVAQRRKRILILAHRRELINQASGKLVELDVPHGVIAGPGAIAPHHVHVGSVQTVARRLNRIPAPDLIIYDEAHHCAAGQYQAIAEAFPRARALGVTATPQRLDGRGLDIAFDTLICGPAVGEMMSAGFLSPVRHLAPPSNLDLSGVRTSMGDYSTTDLQLAVARSTITGDAVSHYRQHCDGAPTVAFCISVDHAEHTAQAFRDAGIASVSVDGSLPAPERAARIRGLQTGQVKVLTSCDLISEGLDIPAIVAVILLRPTKSLTIYMQSIGRALRPAPGKSHAIVLDHVGNIHKHGPVDAPREWSLEGRKRRDREAPEVRVCETCFRTFVVADLPGAATDCTADPCGMAAPEPAERQGPQQVDGELTEYRPPEIIPPPEWVPDGLDIRASRGREWFRLLRAATTESQLADIAKARGYKRGWIKHILAERERQAAGRDRDDVGTWGAPDGHNGPGGDPGYGRYPGRSVAA